MLSASDATFQMCMVRARREVTTAHPSVHQTLSSLQLHSSYLYTAHSIVPSCFHQLTPLSTTAIMGCSRSRHRRRKYKRSCDRPQGEQNQEAPILRLPPEISQHILRYTLTDRDITWDLTTPLELFKAFGRLRSVCWKWNLQMDWVMNKWEQRRNTLIKRHGFELVTGTKHRRWLELLQLTMSAKGDRFEERFRRSQMRLARQRADKQRRDKKRAHRLKKEWEEAEARRERDRMRKLEIRWRRGVSVSLSCTAVRARALLTLCVHCRR